MNSSLRVLSHTTAAAGSILAAALGASTAQAATAPTAIRIASPAPAAAVTGATVPITLHAGSEVTGIEAFIGTRDVSGYFDHVGTQWTARIPRLLVGSGSQRLLVQATSKLGGRTDVSTFTVGHDSSRLLRVLQVGGADGSAVPVTARTRVGTTAALTINGHPIADIDDSGYVTRHRWEITTSDGLRQGINRVSITVTDRHHDVATRRSTFARTPLLGATSSPAFGEQGLYFGTDLESVDESSNDNTMYINGNAYTSTLPAGSAAIMVQLDAKTLAPIASNLNGTPIAPKLGTITIAVWENTDVSFAGTPNGSRVWIGTTEVADNESYNGCGTGGNCNTNLHGWLLPSTGVDPATWTDSDMLNVETRSASDGTNTNTIKVGGQAFPVTLSPGATGGFELLTLDNNGDPTGNPSAYSLTGDATSDAATENQLAQALENAAGEHVTIVLQGFGSLPKIDPTGTLAHEIALLGGNADVISRFGASTTANTADGYALITGRYTTSDSWEWHAQEASTERTGDGTLTALLVRDQTQNDYVPMTGAASTPVPAGAESDALLPLIYQAPTSWTNWIPDGNGGLRTATAAEQAAFSDIADEMVDKGWVSSTSELCPDAPDPVRGALCNSNQATLSSIADDVETQLEFNPTKGSAGDYTQTDFKTAQDAISNEFSDAADIRDAVDDYQTMFNAITNNGEVNTATISAEIQQHLRKSASTTTSDMMAFLGALADMASIVDGGELWPGWGSDMTFASGALSYMSLFQPDTGPGNDLADNIQVTQGTVASDLEHELESGSEELSVYGDFLDADPVKLLKGAAMLNGPYAMSGASANGAKRATEYAVTQYLWGKLLASAYNVWVGPATLGPNPTCIANLGSNEDDPFVNGDANDMWSSVDETTPMNWWIGESVMTTDVGGTSNMALPAALADRLMGPIDASQIPSGTTNVGAVQPYFDETYLTKIALPLNPKQTPPTDDDGCLPHIW